MTNIFYILISHFNFILHIIFFILTLLLILNIKNHPIYIIIILLIYSTLICINISIWKINFILSIFLFLIIIRGLLIIFLYFSRLISNEQFKIRPKLILFILIIYLINIIFLLYYKNSYHTLLNNLFIYKYKFQERSSIYQSNKFNFNNILNLYEYPINNITILSIFYLLFSLFIIIKICSSKFSSLRKIK